ncbi:uncharacterized protein BYT42DRAFT_498766, partial [Radiomyces spectabilis]|uniref:uncharacterized protein n=1 Tax=Radiomyces spectabilis TaxID=64574 RepID=UPI0022200DF1
YCDFCNCSFPDNATNRKNHNEGALHLANRKRHYDWFKVDPEVFIREQMEKPPCRNFNTHGFCEFELQCKGNHITYDYYALQLAQNSLRRQEQLKRTPRYKLPSGWKVRELPPSLKPPPAKHGYEWNNLGFWG